MRNATMRTWLVTALTLSTQALVLPQSSPVEARVERSFLAGDWAAVKSALDDDPPGSLHLAEREILSVACYELHDYPGLVAVQVASQDLHRSDPEIDEWVSWALALVEQHPDSAEAQLLKGSALACRGSTDDALSACQEAMRLDPEWAQACTRCGALLASAGRDAEALTHFGRAVSIDPKDARALGYRAQVRLRGGYVEAAFEDAYTALEIAPDDACAHLAVGLVLIRYDAVSAIKSLNRALQLAPDWAEVWWTQALAKLERDRFDPALKDAGKAIELAPKNASPYLVRSVVYATAGDVAHARADAEQALLLAPPDGRREQARQLLVTIPTPIVWPPELQTGLLPEKRHREKARIPDTAEVKLENPPWVVDTSLEVEDAKTGKELKRTPTPSPSDGEYSFLRPTLVRFSPDDVGREVEISYTSQPPRVALLPVVTDSKRKDVASSARGTLERFFDSLSCEVVPREDVEKAIADEKLDDLDQTGSVASDPQVLAAIAEHLDAALVVACAVTAEEGTLSVPIPDFQKIMILGSGGFLPPEEQTSFTAMAEVVILDGSGTERTRNEAAGFATHQLAGGIFHGSTRRSSVCTAVKGALDGLGFGKPK